MKKSSALAALALMAWSAAAQAQRPTVVIGPGLNTGRTAYHQTFNRTLSPDSTYVLTGQYQVDSLKSLTILPGTVVRADTAAVLIIKRGGKIFANGAPCAPVVFTSLKPAGQRNRGDWGGIVVLGAAPVNKVNPVVEGGVLQGTYGGTNAGDNSGVIKYTRIEYPGYRYQLNNEVNGLTMGGVGSGTEIHHVQVSYSFDDSFEWFGGTVNCKYLIAFGGTDDEFDTDFGYAGKCQFLFAIKDPNAWDPTGQSNGLESDNDASAASTDLPYTEVIFSNLTAVGPERTDALVGATPIGNTFQYSVLHRRSSRMKVYNSALLGYYWGLNLRDANTIAAANGNIIQYRNVSMACSLRPGTSTSVHSEGTWAGVTTWFDTPGFGNNGSQPRSPSALGLTNLSDLGNPNPVPTAGSILNGTADFTNPNLAGLTVVNYRGAFDPALPMSQQWTACWTTFKPENDIVSDAGDVRLPRLGVLEQNHPNPFNPTTAIRFKVPARGQVTLRVYNTRGEVVATVVDQELPAGAYERSFDASKLTSGTYFYRLSGNGFEESRKMQLLK